MKIISAFLASALVALPALSLQTPVGAVLSPSAEKQQETPELAQGVTTVVGCYVARPALTYSATGEHERGDSTWAYVNLLPHGVVRRPFGASRMDRGSWWAASGDSLTVTVSDGFAGWILHLIRVSGGWNGTATYHSDLAFTGQASPTHPITLTTTPRSCSRLDGNDRLN